MVDIIWILGIQNANLIVAFISFPKIKTVILRKMQLLDKTNALSTLTLIYFTLP